MGEYRQWRISTLQLSELQQQGLAYWLERRGDRPMPDADQFELMALPARQLPTTTVVDVLEGGANFRFRFWGSGFHDHLGYDGTGFMVSDLLPEEIRGPVFMSNQFVVRERRPNALMSAFVRGNVTPTLGFQRILRLPLGEDDAVVQIVSLIEFLQSSDESRQIIDAAGVNGDQV